VPVTWGHDERSRLSYLKDGVKMLEEIAYIRWEAFAGAYDRKVAEFTPEWPVVKSFRNWCRIFLRVAISARCHFGDFTATRICISLGLLHHHRFRTGPAKPEVLQTARTPPGGARVVSGPADRKTKIRPSRR
jgi:hypothetical protein